MLFKLKQQFQLLTKALGFAVNSFKKLSNKLADDPDQNIPNMFTEQFHNL